MKKLLVLLLTLTMLPSAASATIYRAENYAKFEDARHFSETPGVLLCESLPIWDAPGDQGGKPIGTLAYTSEAVPVFYSGDGYAQIVLPGGLYGWISSESLLLNPDWYLCDGDTAVYACPDAASSQVAMLDAGAMLPILDETASWVCVSLGGGVGWICKTPQDAPGETWFSPDALTLEGLIGATLRLKEEGPRPGVKASHIFKQECLAALMELLVSAEDMGGPVADCPFGATLTLNGADGQRIILEVATDACCVYRVDGRDYRYAPPDSGVDSRVLFGDVFSTTLPQESSGKEISQ